MSHDSKDEVRFPDQFKINGVAPDVVLVQGKVYQQQILVNGEPLDPQYMLARVYYEDAPETHAWVYLRFLASSFETRDE